MSDKELSGKEFLAEFLAFKDGWEKEVSVSYLIVLIS